MSAKPSEGIFEYLSSLTFEWCYFEARHMPPTFFLLGVTTNQHGVHKKRWASVKKWEVEIDD